MERKYLIKAIKMALKEADHKPLDEAAEIIADTIGMVDEILNDVPMPIQTSPAGAGSDAPSSGVEPMQKVGTKEPTPPSFVPTKVFWEPSQLMAEVTNGTPEFIEVAVPGKDPIRGSRVITAMSATEGSYFGVQVSYPAPGGGPNSPAPKASFWVTTEDLELPAAMSSLQDQANKIYLFTPRNSPNRTPPPGDSIRYVSGGGV